MSPKYFGWLLITVLVLGSLIGYTIYNKQAKIDLDASNAYWWQKYMNEQEFDLLVEGLSYNEVVSIAGGREAERKGDHYIWYDEILLTQAYEIQFKHNKLVNKKIIEIHGYSTR